MLITSELQFMQELAEFTVDAKKLCAKQEALSVYGMYRLAYNEDGSEGGDVTLLNRLAKVDGFDKWSELQKWVVQLTTNPEVQASCWLRIKGKQFSVNQESKVMDRKVYALGQEIEREDIDVIDGFLSQPKEEKAPKEFGDTEFLEAMLKLVKKATEGKHSTCTVAGITAGFHIAEAKAPRIVEAA